MQKRLYTISIIFTFFLCNLAKAQVITTIAGNGADASTGDGGQATAAGLMGPSSIAFDTAGNLYIADYRANVIRKINTVGIISTLAGTGYGADSGACVLCYSGDGGLATNARLNYPWGVAVDASGNVFIADQNNNRIRMVNTNGIITTIAGNGVASYSGDNGPATNAEIYGPYNVRADASGNLYIADGGNGLIRKVNSAGIITTVAGKYSLRGGYSGDGGAATNAALQLPYDMITDLSGNLYINDFTNVRKVDVNGIITTIAGNSVSVYSGNGVPAINSEFSGPGGLALDSIGNLYVNDEIGVVRKIDFLYGTITTVVGDTLGSANNSNQFSGDNGPAVLARLYNPECIAFDVMGNMYIADQQNHRIRKVSNCRNPITLSTNPNITGCPSKPIGLSASGANYYTWSPTIGLNNSHSANPVATLTATTGYSVTATDVSGNCIAFAYDTLFIAPCLVWPGDANEDLNVDNNDLLTLGLKYGYTGPTRSIISNTFQGYACNNWTDTLSNGYNTKYADCNGDGLINMDDTMAININYATGHNQRMSAPKNIQTVNPDIFLSFNKTSYLPGDTVKAYVNIGSSSNAQTNFYGAAFELYYDVSKVKSGSAKFSFNNSWVGNINQSKITLNNLNSSAGLIDASLVRINHTDASGYGKVATFQFILNPSVSNGQLYFTMNSGTKVNHLGASTTLNIGTDSVAVSNATSGINHKSANNGLANIWPNPAQKSIEITIQNNQAADIQLTNLMGQELKRETVSVGQPAVSFDLTNLPNGIYLIKVNSSGQSLTQQVFVNH